MRTSQDDLVRPLGTADFGGEIPHRDTPGLVLVGLDRVATSLQGVNHIVLGLLQGHPSPQVTLADLAGQPQYVAFYAVAQLLLLHRQGREGTGVRRTRHGDHVSHRKHAGHQADENEYE